MSETARPGLPPPLSAAHPCLPPPPPLSQSGALRCARARPARPVFVVSCSVRRFPFFGCADLFSGVARRGRAAVVRRRIAETAALPSTPLEAPSARAARRPPPAR